MLKVVRNSILPMAILDHKPEAIWPEARACHIWYLVPANLSPGWKNDVSTSYEHTTCGLVFWHPINNASMLCRQIVYKDHQGMNQRSPSDENQKKMAMDYNMHERHEETKRCL